MVTAALLAIAPAAASADTVFATTSAASNGARVGAASSSHRLNLLLALRADDAALTAYASAVSNPSSPLYGKYLEPEQIARRFGSSQVDRARVKKALRRAGLTARTGLGGFWIETEATVAQAGELFSTGFASYKASASGKRYVAPTGKPQLPPSLAGTVTGVVGLDDAPIVRAARHGASAAQAAEIYPLTRAQTLAFNASQRAAGSSLRGNLGALAGCDDARSTGNNVPVGSPTPTGFIPSYTPNQVNTAYGLSSLHAKGYKGQGQRIAVIEVDGFSRSDLETAAACFGYRAPPTPTKLVGLKTPLPVGGETTLDLQVIAASSPGLKSIQVIEGDGSLAGLAQQFAAAVQTPSRYRASVISASVGACEPNWTDQAITQLERTLRAANVAGITVTAAAGDTGSTGCSLDDNAAALPGAAVWYPSSSSWVTGVGGTNFSLNSANRITEEVVWNDSPTAFGGGGGGTSIGIKKPAWQSGPGVGTGEGREVPDIALLSDSIPGYPIYCSASDCLGGWSNVGGTSAATPLFASGVLITNQQAKAAKQPQLGFLNKKIYKLAAKSSTRTKVFRDVTKVGNDLGKLIGPSFAATGCCSATKYYDRASGWGSVNFPAFSQAARKLGGSRASAVAGNR
jgi:subtilase family serine protease